MKKNSPYGHGWAWKCDFGVCYWVEPTKDKLIKKGKPSPEAKPVAVRVVLERDFCKLFGKTRRKSCA